MELYRFLPFAQSLDDIRKAALIELTFNVGIEKVIQFRKMIDALKNKDFELASNEMLDSEWAKEVGNRANKLSAWIKTGEMS
jgi:lysozyme